MTCRLPRRCLRYHSYRHLARDYRWPRRAAASTSEVGVAAHGPPCTRHMVAPTEPRRWLWGGTNGFRRRRRRCRSKLPREIYIATTGNVATSTIARCSQESDPLVVALREGARPPVWVDPMLDELAASLVVSRSTGAPALWRPFTQTTASLEVQASLADTRSSPRMVQLSFADAKAPG